MTAHTRPLTPAEIASVPDGKIDFDDIPELDSDFWREAELGRPDRTEQITMRVKRSVLDYFRAPRQGIPDPDQPRARKLCAGSGRVVTRGENRAGGPDLRYPAG